MTHVTIDKLTFQYTGTQVPAVRDISIEIESGKIAALLGPSGSGKSTILKMIAGLLRPTSGDICFGERSILNIPAEKRSAVMVFQNYMLFPHMTVAQNIGFGLKMRGMKQTEIETRIREMLKRVQLPDLGTRRPNELSGGQQQRVALARALVTDPALLLLDEPLSNLDAHLREEMRSLIFSIQRETEITTILVTHDQEEAVYLADKIALLEQGTLQQYATSEEFYRYPRTEKIARFFGGLNFIEVQHKGDEIATAFGDFIIYQIPVTDDKVRKLTIRPEQIELGVPTDMLNTFTAHVQSCVYLGTHMRYKLLANGILFHAIDSHRLPGDIETGSDVTVHFPPEHLWLVEA